jgi:hypothetical protein
MIENYNFIGCPKELQLVGDDIGYQGSVIGCKSACEAFGSDQYCCSGQFANPTTCQPSYYSTIFKKACPRAYSYAFDDGTSTFTCKAYEYDIIFCPTSNKYLLSPSNTIIMSFPFSFNLMSRAYDIRSKDIVGIRCVPECLTLVRNSRMTSVGQLRQLS